MTSGGHGGGGERVTDRAARRSDRLQLTQLTLGYWRSQVLFTALELGVFEALAGGAASAESLAQRAGAPTGSMERLLRACVSLGLLEARDQGFAPSPLAERFLVPGGAEYLGNWVGFMARYYGAWGSLATAIRTGKPVPERPERSRPEYAREMILAMHDYAMVAGRAMVRRVPLDGRRRLLDVGGGAGSYAILFAREHAELEAEVLDLPPVVEVARDVIRQAGVADRVSVRAGDYLAEPFGAGYDVVLMSNMLHQEDPATCRRLLAKAGDALVPGGLLVIQLSFLDADRTGPPWAVLQGLQLLLFYEGGRTYAVDEMVQLARDAGFRDIEHRTISLAASEGLVLARKPAAVAAET